MIKIASWNIRGINKTSKQKEVRNLIKEEGIEVCAILETRLNAKKESMVAGKIFGTWEWHSNIA